MSTINYAARRRRPCRCFKVQPQPPDDRWIKTGKNIYELLSSGCPFDFNKFKEKKGSTTQTILNHVDVIIHHNDINNINLFVRRSFSEHLWSWINDSGSRL